MEYVQVRNYILRYSRAPDAKRETGAHHSGRGGAHREQRTPLSMEEYRELMEMLAKEDFSYLLPIMKHLAGQATNVPNCAMQPDTKDHRRLLQACAAKGSMYTIVHHPHALLPILKQCVAAPRSVSDAENLLALQKYVPLLTKFIKAGAFFDHIQPLVKYLALRTEQFLTKVDSLPALAGHTVSVTEDQGASLTAWSCSDCFTIKS